MPRKVNNRFSAGKITIFVTFVTFVCFKLRQINNNLYFFHTLTRVAIQQNSIYMNFEGTKLF